MSQNRKKKLIRTERTSVIIPSGKDWGQAFSFFQDGGLVVS